MPEGLTLYQFAQLVDSEKDNVVRWRAADPDGRSDLSKEARQKMVARFRGLSEQYRLNWWQRLVVKYVLWRQGKRIAPTVERTQPVQAGISGEANKKGEPNG